MLTPAAFHELAIWAVNHGLTAAVTATVLTSAFDDDFNDRKAETHETHETAFHETHETPAVAPVPSRKTSTLRVQAFRARQAAKRVSVSSGVSCVSPPPLSLIENTDPLRERAQNETPKRVSPEVMPLPDDWQPDGKSWGVAVETIGEASALVLAANFRDHYLVRPHDQRRSEEHTSELQSRQYLVCRLLLEKKKHSVSSSNT